MLALFGCAHLDAIYRGYQSVHPLTRYWRDRVALHQLTHCSRTSRCSAPATHQTAAAARAVIAL